jgi:hypothetical protein
LEPTEGRDTERLDLPMPDQNTGTTWSDPWTAERAIVLQVLREDKDPRWTLADLRAEAYDIDPSALGNALSRLKLHGIAVTCGEAVVASRAALHLDALGMVSI